MIDKVSLKLFHDIEGAPTLLLWRKLRHHAEQEASGESAGDYNVLLHERCGLEHTEHTFQFKGNAFQTDTKCNTAEIAFALR